MPKVSVIVPLYKAKKYIIPCVSALKRQGLTELEILLVDDCSPDDTYAYARELFRDDATVRVFQNEYNGGPGKARNTGLELAMGEYVCFCDVDDLYVDGALSEMLREAERVGADVYCSNEFYITVADPLPDDLSTLGEENLLRVGLISMEESQHEGNCVLAGSLEERMRLWLMHRYHWSVFGKLFRTQFLRQKNIRFSDARLGEDQLFMLKALMCAQVYADQVKCPYIYRAGNVDSVSRGSKNPGVFINAMKAIFVALDSIDGDLAGIPYFDAHPEYRERLKAYHIQGIEEGYAIPKFFEIGREELNANRELDAVFSVAFEVKGDFVKKTLFDAYEGRSPAASLEAFLQYENLKELKETVKSGFFSLL